MKFAYFNGYICTANEDGSIPLNSQVVCFVSDLVTKDRSLLERLLQLANRPETESPS